MRAAFITLAIVATGCGKPPPDVQCEILVPTPERDRCQAAATCGRITWDECGR